jgi:hypothetical protein
MADQLMHSLPPLGHRPSVKQLQNDLHLLLRLLLAGEALAHFAAMDLHRDPKVFEHAAWEAETVSDLLISSCALLRVLDDSTERSLLKLSTYVGTLKADLQHTTSEVTGLTLHEACDKVIHAKTVYYDKVDTPCGLSYLRPIVELTGTANKKPRNWRATINLVELVRESLVALQKLDIA